MKKKALNKIIFIFLLSFLAFYISLPQEIPLKFNIGSLAVDRKFIRRNLDTTLFGSNIVKNFDLKLGLDLSGGSHLVFETATEGMSDEDKKDALESLRNIIEQRVNLYGVSEPNVQISSFEGKDRVIVELPGVKNKEEAKAIIGQTAKLVFAEVGSEEEPGIKETELTGANLKRARVNFDSANGEPVVSIEFDETGATLFSELTARNIGKPLVILIDDIPISSPIVNSQISGGNAQISGGFDLTTAKNLAIQLNAGALPLSINLIEERTVEATLGKESVEKSIKAGIIGILMVMLFMMLVYGKLGIVSGVGLFVFSILTLALYKLIPVVLTLPGIAGFMLSIGMAVDSNILIFERLKEEIGEREISNALEVSFGRAWDSIRDANVATLVTAFILANPLEWEFLHTSGPVRGFAITLALGIGISLFTGIVVTRNLLRIFIKS